MSHISKIELEITDLETLRQACHRMGLEFRKEQKRFKWFGKDAPCDHVIHVPQARYQIGVVKNDHHYGLVCDFYDRTLVDVIGQNGGLLKQAYAVAKTRRTAKAKGYVVIENQTDTAIQLTIRVP